jgi:hypothetical protein
MSSGNPLEDWHFLLGEWQGQSKDPESDEGVIETSDVYTLEMDGVYIMGRHKAVKDGKVVHEAISLMYHDKRTKKLRRKSAYSYGFVNNEVEFERTKDVVRFDIEMEPSPQAFDGMRWKSYINKISENEIREGLEVAKGEEDFTTYADNASKKIR